MSLPRMFIILTLLLRLVLTLKLRLFKLLNVWLLVVVVAGKLNVDASRDALAELYFFLTFK